MINNIIFFWNYYRHPLIIAPIFLVNVISYISIYFFSIKIFETYLKDIYLKLSTIIINNFITHFN